MNNNKNTGMSLFNMNPENENEFSAEPYTEEQRKADKHFKDVYHLIGVLSESGSALEKEYQLIKQKKSDLSKRYREVILKEFEK